MVEFNNLTSSETDRVKNVVTPSVEEELGRQHRGVDWSGLSFAVSLDATTQRSVLDWTELRSESGGDDTEECTGLD